MVLTVAVSETELEEHGRVLTVGEREQFWLTFEEGERLAAPERMSVIRGLASPLPAWSGAVVGRHPVRIDVEGGSLYWDAPEQVAGPIEVTGTIRTNDIDVPDEFPETAGLVRRIRMVWHDVVMTPEGVWLSTGADARYEDVQSSYFPVREPSAFDPETEAELRRMAREAYDWELAAGRLSPGESFQVGLKVPATRKIPVGTTETRWIGVLIDLETVEPKGLPRHSG